MRRFVHVSSLAAREPELSDYGASKARSEELVARLGPRLAIVRPPAVYGPGDQETLELFKMAQARADPAAAQGPPVAHPRRRSRRLLLALAMRRERRPDADRARRRPAGRLDPSRIRAALGRAVGRRAVALSMPRAAAAPRRRARPARPPRQGEADPRPRRLFLPSRLGRQPAEAAPARLWQPAIDTRQALGQRRLVPGRTGSVLTFRGTARCTSAQPNVIRTCRPGRA